MSAGREGHVEIESKNGQQRGEGGEEQDGLRLSLFTTHYCQDQYATLSLSCMEMLCVLLRCLDLPCFFTPSHNLTYMYETSL